MSKVSFFVDLDCQDAVELKKCVKRYPEYDWYLGFNYTKGKAPDLPEKLGRKRLQLFNIPCPKLPQVGSHVGLFCSNNQISRQWYCEYYLKEYSTNIPVFIVRMPKQDLQLIPPRMIQVNKK